MKWFKVEMIKPQAMLLVKAFSVHVPNSYLDMVFYKGGWYVVPYGLGTPANFVPTHWMFRQQATWHGFSNPENLEEMPEDKYPVPYKIVDLRHESFAGENAIRDLFGI